MPAEQPQGSFDSVHLAGRLSVLDVVAFGELSIAVGDFIDREI